MCVTLQGEEGSHAAHAVPGEASEGGSPVHRVSFSISMDISALSGAGSNVEIVPISEALLQPAHAQLAPSGVKVRAATQPKQPSMAPSADSIEEESRAADAEPAAESGRRSNKLLPAEQDAASAAATDTVGTAHDGTGCTGDDSSQCREVEEQQVQRPAGIEQGTHASKEGISMVPSPSEEEVARSILDDLRYGRLTGSDDSLADDAAVPDVDRSSNPGTTLSIAQTL